MADYEGYEQFETFVGRAKRAGVSEVVMSIRGDTVGREVRKGVWTAQPVIEITCVFYLDSSTEQDPLATEAVTWTVREEPATGAEEQAAVDRIARALRARGLSVAAAGATAY